MVNRNFHLDSIELSTKEITDGDSLIVFASVSNTGSIDGSKNIDLFISDEYASISPANKKLKSFTKVNLESGESTKISFLLTSEDFAYINDSGERILEKGTFIIEILNKKIKINLI